MSSLSVADAAREAPNQPALIVGSRITTYRELSERVARRVAWLESEGAPFGDSELLSVVGTSDLDTLETVLAAIEIGQPIVLVHPRLTQPERTAIVSVAMPRRHLDAAPPESSLPAAERMATRARIDPERALCVLFTSGTSGRPKGVILSRRAFIASAAASAENIGWHPDDRWLLGLPIAHVGGLSILTRCLLARRTVVVPYATAMGRRLDPYSLATELDRHRVTLVSLVPTQLDWLLSKDPPWVPPPHLRAVLLGGAGVRASLLERAADRRVPVLTTYGLTEACSQVTTQSYGTVNRGDLGAGAPMAGVEVRIVDGAIQVRGPTLLTGLFASNAPAPVDEEGWLRTDDLGRLDERGFLHVLGRRTDLIITGGENVHPAEVEAVLECCPGIAAACVFGIPDDTWGEVVAAALISTGPKPPSPEQLAAFIGENLSPHRTPRRIAFVRAFATTAAGKLDRTGTARECRQAGLLETSR